MQQKDIKPGETYLFVATDSPERKHLEGREFTVVYKKAVWRKFKGLRTKKQNRFFNEDGVGARAEELEEIYPEVHIYSTLSPEHDESYNCTENPLDNLNETQRAIFNDFIVKPAVKKLNDGWTQLVLKGLVNQDARDILNAENWENLTPKQQEIVDSIFSPKQ